MSDQQGIDLELIPILKECVSDIEDVLVKKLNDAQSTAYEIAKETGQNTWIKACEEGAVTVEALVKAAQELAVSFDDLIKKYDGLANA